jgi:hypothetical protein
MHRAASLNLATSILAGLEAGRDCHPLPCSNDRCDTTPVTAAGDRPGLRRAVGHGPIFALPRAARSDRHPSRDHLTIECIAAAIDPRTEACRTAFAVDRSLLVLARRQ